MVRARILYQAKLFALSRFYIEPGQQLSLAGLLAEFPQAVRQSGVPKPEQQGDRELPEQQHSQARLEAGPACLPQQDSDHQGYH